MCEDSDMKIAGAKPSRSVARAQADNTETIRAELEQEKQSGNLDRARTLGMRLAEEFDRAQGEFAFGLDSGEDGEVKLQRRLLLCFAVAVGLEQFTVSALVARTALNVFYNTLKKIDVEFYEDLNNTGAFSFYYLALRRGMDVERRIGQTFAMLCSRDGDPVYQELGEALYCRFLASVRGEIRRQNLLREPKDGQA